MMKTVSSSETFGNIYQTTRDNILEDGHLHTRRRDNLIIYIGLGTKFLIAHKPQQKKLGLN